MKRTLPRYLLSLIIVLGLLLPGELLAQERVTYDDHTPTFVYTLVGTTVGLIVVYWLTTRDTKRTPSELYQDLHPETYLFSSKQSRTYESLRNNQERESFVETFWKAKDPTPHSIRNERREAFIDEVDYTNENFAEPTLPGWLSDRGRFYILFGPPDEVQSTSMASVIWYYDRPSGGNHIPLVYAGYSAGNMFAIFWDENSTSQYELAFTTELIAERRDR